jgi:hypothetical protein
MALDATSVVWCAADDGTVNAAPRDGGTAVVVAAYYRCASVAVNLDGVFFASSGQTLQAGATPKTPRVLGPGGVLAADEHNVYVGNHSGIMRIATLLGADPTPVTVVNDPGITAIAVDATGIFWVAFDGTRSVGAVRSVAK